MTKVIRVEEDGFVWEVPAILVAISKAEYYRERAKSQLEHTDMMDYYSMVQETLNDDYELKDWFVNSANPQEFGEHFKLVDKPEERDYPQSVDNVAVVDNEG